MTKIEKLRIKYNEIVRIKAEHPHVMIWTIMNFVSDYFETIEKEN